MKKLSTSTLSLGLAGLLILAAVPVVQAQTGIGTRTPDGSAALDITSTNRGLLIPRVALQSATDGATISSPATSLMVYNTNPALGSGVGFYYNAGTTTAPNWVRFVSTSAPVGLEFWRTTGNAGTSPTTNFLGTTDAQDLAFRVNNTERMRLRQDGALNLGTLTSGNMLVGLGSTSGGLTGIQNTFVGVEAGRNTISGIDNTFLGRAAGRANVSGIRSTFLGSSAGMATTGDNNTFIGYGAGINNVSGTGNVAVGVNAGSTGGTGDNNTLIGNGAFNVGSLTNSTAIGAGAQVAISNALVLGNAVNVGIGTSSPTATLHVAGSGSTVRLEPLANTNSANNAGTRMVTVDATGVLFTRDLPGGVNDFVQNLSSANSAQTANFNINGTGLIGTRLGIGTTAPQQPLDVAGNATVSGNLGVGVLNPTQKLDVAGGANISNALNVGGAATLNSANITTAATVGSTLNVAGLSTLGSARISNLGAGTVFSDGQGNLSVQTVTPVNAVLNQNAIDQNANFRISGTGQVGQLAVNNNATVGGTLGVTGATTINNTLNVTGAATAASAAISGNLGVGGAATVGGSLSVSGPTTLNNLTATTTSVGALAATSANVTGNATVSSATVGNLGGSGTRLVVTDNSGNLTTQAIPTPINAILNQNANDQSANFRISGSGQLGTSLGVGTALTVGTSAVVGTSLNVNGATTLSSATINNTLNVSGATTIASLGGSGNRLVVTNNVGNLSTQEIPTAGIFNQTTQQAGANFNITGSGTVGSLTANNAVNVGTALTVGTTANVGTSLAVGSTLSTGGTATLNSAIVTNTLGVTGATTLNNTLNVNGNTTLASLAGSGSRLVVANATGQLSTQPAPAAGIFNQTTQQSGANFNIDGSGQIGTTLNVGTAATVGTSLSVGSTLTTASQATLNSLNVTNTSTLNGATTIGTTGSPTSLTVNGSGTFTNLANNGATANRVVVSNNAGQLIPTTFTLPTAGFVENRVHSGGITSPAGQQGSFDLDGTGYLGGSLTSAASVVAGADVQAGANVTVGANLTVGAFSRFGNNVGIGLTSTNAPLTERLTVNGNIVPEAAGLGTLGTAGAFGLRWNGLYVENALIGIPNPNNGTTDRLTVNGNILPFIANASNLGSSTQRWGTLYVNNVVNTSDARLKTNINTINYGLNSVLAMRPVRYAWKTTPNKVNQLGFLAQEMQKLVPEVVSVGTDANKTMGINYVALVPVLVKAIQEQQAEIDALKTANASLLQNGDRAAAAEQRAEKAEAALQSFESRLRALEAGQPTAQGQR